MSWYLVKIIFQIICGNGKHTPQFEEQLRMISASTAREAISKANELALKEEETFHNRLQQPVQWSFIAVTDIFSFETGIDGAALFSRILEEENASSFIYTARLRSQDAWKSCVEIIHQ